MLRRIKLRNFKCFEALDLACAPLNVLCGLNGMGKSSVIQALLVLRQSFESRELEAGGLVLGGDLTDLGAGSDVLFEDADGDRVGFELWRESLDPWTGIFAYSSTQDRLTVVPDQGSQTIPAAWRDVPPFGGALVNVEAERIGPRKFYALSQMKARMRNLGTRGEHAWNYLSEHQSALFDVDDPRRASAPGRRLIEVVDYWLQDVSPGAHLHLDTIRSADAVVPGYTFDRPGDVASRQHRATNVGFGLSYVLPVVLALLMPSETLCLIENPEAHLHPRGQTRLAELTVRAVRAGLQVFVETHSDHFLDGIRVAVHDGLSTPSDVAIHYFERAHGRSVVASPTLDGDGRLSHWPSGFFDQHEENLARLLTPRS